MTVRTAVRGTSIVGAAFAALAGLLGLVVRQKERGLDRNSGTDDD